MDLRLLAVLQRQALLKAAGKRAARTLSSGPVEFWRQLLDALPHPYIVLDLDFTIIDVNPAFLQLTLTDGKLILGRNLFDVFPENPAQGKRNMIASVRHVIQTKRMDRMRFQRYDIRDRSGVFVERYWNPVNCPIFDKRGNVEFILHTVEEASAAERLLNSERRPRKIWRHGFSFPYTK